MNKEIKILDYDNFKCIADKCKFTCCAGWDVSIDSDTYNKWEKESERLLSKVIKCDEGYSIDKETHEACPFLDNKGLCHVVKKYGEEYLSSTCHSFPRVENIFEDIRELSLSCACPEVVELISNMNGKINIVSKNQSNLTALKIRKVIVNIIQQDKFSLEEKLIISFQMISTILENEEFIDELEKYNDSEYISTLIGMYKEIELNIDDSIEETNNLFLDIIENYKEVSTLDSLLKNISEFAENIEIENLSYNWDSYKEMFSKHNVLVENCIVSKILNSCVSNDIEEMTVSLEMIILEYLLVRYAVFLKYSMNENREVKIEDIKDYIVAFSRIIGNNTDAVIEFLSEGFGDSILEIGYLCYISLF